MAAPTAAQAAAIVASRRLVGPTPTVGRLGEIDTTARNPVGMYAFDQEGNSYVYLEGVASVVLGTWVSFDELGLTIRAVANAQGRVAVATGAIVASNWGWFAVRGNHPAKALTAFADNGKIYLTSTAGSVDDTDVSADIVIGAVGRSAVDETSLLITAELNNPMVQDTILD